MNKLNLPENIIRLRHERRITQEELADFLGVTKAAVSKWEKGQNTPDLLLLPQLASFFGITVDEIIGYEAQLSKEQIRRYYAELSKEFANQPFEEVLERTRALAHQYYACYPFLLQLGILYYNHFMLAETEEGRRQILLEAGGWCDRILEHCNDVGVCSDALVLKAGMDLQLGKAAEAVQALGPEADPSRLTGQHGSLLIQAYQMAGEHEKARIYAQAKYYLDLMNLVADAVLSLSFNETDKNQCEETVRRVNGILDLYHLETLHPNMAAQFHYQSAVMYAANGEEEDALKALSKFGRCVERLLDAEQIELHGDGYFNLLEEWLECLPLGSMAPRDKSFIWQSLQGAMQRPVFHCIRNREEFQKLARKWAEGGKEND